MRDQNRGGVSRRGQDAIENLRLAAHVELRRRFVEQHHTRAQLDRAQRPRERNPLPLPAGEIGAVLVSAREDRVERREMRRAGLHQRLLDRLVGRTGGRNVVAQRQLEPDEVLKHRRDALAPCVDVELAQIDAIDLDRAFIGIVEPAQQLRERGLARAILADDRERRTGRNRQIETVQHRVLRPPDTRS